MNTTRLEYHLNSLYGPKAGPLLIEIEKLSHQYEAFEYQERNPYWYKYLNLYIMYPDSLYGKGKNPLQRVCDHIPHIQSLGCTALHILPFLESPMVDKGFDISDFYAIRKDLGHLNDLRDIIRTAKEHGIRVFMDLVFNHVSDQHEWFQRAQEGDKEYREMFVYTNKKPEYIRTFDKDAAVWAEFMVNGEPKAVNVAFPEFCGEVPLWREGKDGYWYYHTYYPQQPDINWFNPNVFLEFTKILFFWTSLGFNFRLDAIPFVGQYAYKEASSDTQTTHHLVSALRNVAQMINHECAFIVETYERLDSVVAYFGTTNHREAQLSYNFHLCTDTWITLVEQDSKYIWSKLKLTSKVPNHAEWINFLRNHDELSLAYVGDDMLKKVLADIGPGGIPFRKGHGVAGRTRSLLDGNVKRFLMAFTLLACAKVLFRWS